MTNVFALSRKLRKQIPAALALGIVAALAAALPASGASYTWNVASGNWSSPSSWTPTTTSPNGPLAADSVTFGNNDTVASPTSTPDNTMDSGFGGSVSNLTYNSAGTTAAYHITQIPAGQTLTAQNVLVGGVNQTTAYITYAYLTGGGTFKATGNFMVQNYGSASGANATAYLNLSGLTNFIYTNDLGTISIIDNPGSLTRAGGNMTLAANDNFITASNINLGTSTAAQAGPAGLLVLGPGTNVINVANITVGSQKSTFTITNSGGGLKIRGVSGANTDRANITVGSRNVNGGSGNTIGNMLLSGSYVDIKAATLAVGENPTAAPNTSGDAGIGLFQFDTGIVDATNVVMAYNTAPNSGVARAYSTLIVGANGTLLVGAGGISLLNQTASNVCSSTLIISNGTVVCNGNITVATNVTAGTGASAETNVIDIIGSGSLTLGQGCFAGTASSPIGLLSLDTTSSLRFATPPNNGQPAVVVNTLNWPANDSALTLVVSNLPSTATVGTTVPLVQFSAMTGGTFTAPVAVLPTGVTGSLSLSGNTIVLTITSSVYPYFPPIPFTPATLCTNTSVIFPVASLVTTITNAEVIAQTTTLGGVTNVMTTNVLGSAGLTVPGLGTSAANITYALAPNTIYNFIIIKATDQNGASITETLGRFDTLSPALVIEASDFNFSGGQFIDTPQNGGVALYTNQVGIQGIDENKGTRTATKSYYRPNDAVIIQSANSVSLTEQKFLVAAADGDTVDVEQEVGYNTPGDWLNYTRTFGSGGSAPAGTYNVWCYLATSGTNAQCGFSALTSDPTQGSQTTNFLGNFGNSSFTDSNYNYFVYVPLVDQFGNRVAVTVTNGQNTFKSTVVGNPNIAFYMLVPVAPQLTPQMLHVYPDGSASGEQPTNHFTFTVGPAQGASISTNGIQLIMNGVDVSSALSFSQVGGVVTATLAIQSNLLYSAVINVTNASGFSISYPVTFDTLNLNSFQWEAVDYDFSTNDGTAWHSGLFIDNPMPTGDQNAGTTGNPYANASPLMAPNSYNWYPEGFNNISDPYAFIGAVALQGVDINYTNAAGMQYAYRYDGTSQVGGTQTPPVVGSSIATDTLNGGLRYQFLAAQTNTSDNLICEFNLGWFNTGDWVNYTRTYPTGNFNVWSRLAGGAGAFSGTTLSLVTGGVGTSNQTTQVLGSFADANPVGWQTYHWVPLLDTNGNRVTVSFNGRATLRLTSGNNLNPLFFMLTPALTPGVFSIHSAQSGGNIQISIPTTFGFNYTIWQASSLSGGVWTQVGSSIPGDDTVHTVSQPNTGGQTFYRVSAQ